MLTCGWWTEDAAAYHHVRHAPDAANKHTEHLKHVADISHGAYTALFKVEQLGTGMDRLQALLHAAEPGSVEGVLRGNVAQKKEAHVPARRRLV